MSVSSLRISQTSAHSSLASVASSSTPHATAPAHDDTQGSVCTSTTAPTPIDATNTRSPTGALDALHAVAVQCEELQARTTIICDEMTDFQRLVSHRSAERHGVWSYSMETQTHQYFCDQCGHYVDAVRADSTKRGLGDSVPFELHGNPMRTPYCSYAELQSSEGCLYTRDALQTLRRREVFDQDTDALLKRLRAASRGIQDSIV